jgi:predicted amidohydrolase
MAIIDPKGQTHKDSWRTLRVGLGQMLVEGGQKQSNLVRAQAMIRAAASRQCDVVVLPEASAIGWTDDSAMAQAEPISGPFVKAIARVAAEAAICVVAGVTEAAGAHIYNTSIFLDSSGRLLGTHRKINILSIAKHLYTVGDTLQVISTPIGRVGMPICADISVETPSIGFSLGRMGARIILSPSAWAVRPEHDNQLEPYGEDWKRSYVRLSQAFGIPVMGVSSVGAITSGSWHGYRVIGSSLAVDADGSVAVAGPYGDDAETLLIADVSVCDEVPAGAEVIE